MTTINKILQILFFAFIIWLFTKIFIFQTFQIYTPSMHNSMHEGDFILVNKLAYGPRFPITPLSFSWGNQHLFLDWIKLPYLRLPGYSSVKKNDIIFNLLFKFEYFDLLHRCLADYLTNDTINFTFLDKLLMIL